MPRVMPPSDMMFNEIPETKHQEKCRHDRHRNRDADDERRGDVAQEEHQNEDREAPTDERRGQHFGYGLANVAGLVRDQLQLESFAEPLEPLLEGDDPLLHRLGDGNGVRATFFNKWRSPPLHAHRCD